MSSPAPKSSEPKPGLKPRKIAQRMLELMRPRRKALLLGLALLLVGRLSGLVLPGASKYLVDEVVGNGRREWLWPLLWAAGLSIAVQGLCSYALIQLLSKSAQKLISELRVQIMRHIGRLPVRYYDERKTGELVSRIMNDVEGVRNLVGTGLVELVGGLITAVVAFGLLLAINWRLTLVTLGLLVVFAVLLGRAFKVLRPIFRERGALNAEVTGRLTESLGGVRVVKGFRAEEREARAFETGVLRLFENVATTLQGMAKLGLSTNLLVGVAGVAVLGLSAHDMLAGRMSVGDFLAFTLYLGVLIAPVVQLVSIGSQLTEAFAGLDRMDEVLREVPEDADPARCERLEHFGGRVRFEAVDFEYESGKPVLLGLDFEAAPGTVTALVGPSGSGKSTLIGLVAAFHLPTRGRVLVDELDLARVRLADWRGQLGVVLQENFLFDGTIAENIAFGRPEATAEQVAHAARIAHVDEFAARFEKGLETVVGERGVKLSGGQRQRVSIARAVLADPRLLILDEATSSLDSESEAHIQDGLQTLMAGRTSFVIAHRLSTVRRADQILFLEGGRIVERGTHTELLAQRGRYHALYTRQYALESDLLPQQGADREAAGKQLESAKLRQSGPDSALGLLRGPGA